MRTLSLLPAAALLALAAGCAGPSKDDSFESVASYMAYEPAAEASVEPATAQEEAGEGDEPAPSPPPATSEEQWERDRLDAGLSTRTEMERDRSSHFDYILLGLAGVRMLDTEWEPIDEQITGGANFMARGPGGWFHWDITLLYSQEDDGALGSGGDEVEVESRTLELGLGVAKVFGDGRFRPYVGVGAAFVSVDADRLQIDEAVSDDDATFGGYGRAGFFIDVTGTGGLIGVEARYLVGTSVELGGVETDVDGLQGYFTIGFSW